MIARLLVVLMLFGLSCSGAEPPLSDAQQSQLHIEYWFNAATVHRSDIVEVLVLFRNDSVDEMKFNGSNYYPDVELFSLNGHRIKTNDELESERSGSRIVSGKDYIPDSVVVPAKGTVVRQYEFAPWRYYTLKPGSYIAKVKGSKAEFIFVLTK